MGYTHYWRQESGAIPTDVWGLILEDARKLFDDPGCPAVAYEHNVNAPAEINSAGIRFNGIHGDGCETFLLARDGDDFQFCKTQQKPYDKLVVALLAVAKDRAPDFIQVSSDGDSDDWAEGLGWASSVLGRTIADPTGYERVAY